MKNTIKELIAEILEGDFKAQFELFEIYQDKIDKYLSYKFKNNIDHHDDVSEISIKIFENLKNFDESKSNFDTWIHTIAKNYMIDKSRKKKPVYVSFTSNTFNTDDILSNTISTNMMYDGGSSNTTFMTSGTINQSFDMLEPESYYLSPHNTLETKDSLDFISNKIGINEFSMLTMKYKEGYSYDEIAKEFNSDESKISNKVNYSKLKIKKGR